MSSCDVCLSRRWLLERLAGHIERRRATVMDLLELADRDLITLVGGEHQDQINADYASLGAADHQRMLGREAAAGLEPVCLHADAYPQQLRKLRAAPAVLSVNGGARRLEELGSSDAVAIVGTRKPTSYGLAAATTMARELSGAGLTVVSGMAFGIDSAAHAGALEGGGRTIAVLAGGANRPYPVRKSGLFRRILERGAVISELGPDIANWRWALQARNRVIAGLAVVTVLIEAPPSSGALITVSCADRLERWIGALPGPVDSAQSTGPNRLLATARTGRGAVERDRVRAVRNAQDVLDLIYGEGIVEAPPWAPKPPPSASESALLVKIADGLSNVTMIEPKELGNLTGLELKGWVSRSAGGALAVVRS